jgi:hypothetical protein
MIYAVKDKFLAGSKIIFRISGRFDSTAAGSDVILRRKPSADGKYAYESQQTLKFQCLQAMRLKIAF